MKKIIILIAIAAIGIAGSSVFVPTFGDYSDGTRSGILQKFSNKGMIVKTHEGELAMEGMTMKNTGDGTTSTNIFAFSVIDKAIIASLDSLIGKKITVKYVQKLHANVKDGATDYFITSVIKAK